ncbi:MAG TPA: hypothetical protein VNB94_06525, partial [Mycobacteriales bacterium]|nr:hypothetical protein [Mycobacteriales bacterium]
SGPDDADESKTPSGGGGGAPPRCRDGLDNDSDGATDHPADPGCSGPDDASESNTPGGGGGGGTPQCSDGIDNDSDGATDFPADPGCQSAQDLDENNGASSTCQRGGLLTQNTTGDRIRPGVTEDGPISEILHGLEPEVSDVPLGTEVVHEVSCVVAVVEDVALPRVDAVLLTVEGAAPEPVKGVVKTVRDVVPNG